MNRKTIVTKAMNRNTVVTKAIDVVAVLFLAFGGFLTNFAPPEETDSKAAVGIASFIALIVLLLVSLLAKNKLPAKYRALWLTFALIFFAVTVVVGFSYNKRLHELTFSYPPESTKPQYVRGSVLTPEAQVYWSENPQKTTSQVVADFGGLPNRELVWTSNSILESRLLLTKGYVLFVLALSCTIFGLVEGLLAKPV